MKSGNILLKYAIFILLTAIGCQKSDNPPDNLQIGQSFQGGIIFYLDGTGQHGLVAANKDQSSAVQWQLDYYNTGVLSDQLGTGGSNTTQIINACGGGLYAATAARNYNGGGYTDWFLPSKEELNLMYVNLKSKNLGNFTDNFYWSSSGYNDVLAWIQEFKNGDQSTEDKNDNFPSVRAARSF